MKKLKPKKFNKYEQRTDAELDLHGYTRLEAEALLIDFLVLAKEKNYRRIRIIIGKGHHSANGQSILGEFIRTYLHHKLIKFSEAKINEGGSGALEIKL